ncbi:hypothetical protein G797_02867, partial [Escherichia coli HVH 139 (4-3192644)]
RTSRFIPAGAGNSDLKIASQYWRAVYPRWRGELSVHPDSRPCDPGLSPLARGTLILVAGVTGGIRFIPAGAGNSTGVNYSTTATPVYPRWRGELQTGRHVWLTANGLSPLARGTPITQGRQCGPFRFIPAGAGNSYIIDMERGKWEVYPRWRGELVCSCWGVAAIAGLSPLARGTL